MFARHLIAESPGTRHLLAVLALLAAPAFANDIGEPPPTVCNPDFTAATGSYGFVNAPPDMAVPADSVIGEIRYTRLEIFDESDPRENNAIYRFANNLHFLTKERIVARNVLFASGETYDPLITAETGRLLRSEGYLYDADVRPVSVCDGVVDVEVITRDVWSLTPDISFSRSGGENTYRFAIAESNLFGLGQDLGITLKQDLDRETSTFYYRNRNINGTRMRTFLEVSDSDDGAEQEAVLVMPFYELDSRRSWGARFKRLEQVDPQFARGERVTEVRRENEDHWVYYGFSSGRQGKHIGRWNFGYRYTRNVFSPTDDLLPPDPFPQNRRLSYPYIHYQSLVDNYATASNLNQIYRTEDLQLGHNWETRFGVAAEAFGSDQNRLILETALEDILIYDGNILLLHELEFYGLWNLDSSRAEDVIMEYNIRYFRHQTAHRSFFMNFNGVISHNLNTNSQVVLGGETGARGFRNRFQTGDRRFVLTVEERLYSDFHWFNLIRPGWAIFLDVGRAWEPGVDDDFEDDYLANIGFGLRLAVSKADQGRIVHVDFAVPLTNRDALDVNSTEITITIKDEF